MSKIITIFEECPPEYQDLVILIDGSGSVKANGFDSVKTWIIKLASKLDLASGKTRIGVVQYSHYFRRA